VNTHALETAMVTTTSFFDGFGPAPTKMFLKVGMNNLRAERIKTHQKLQATTAGVTYGRPVQPMMIMMMNNTMKPHWMAFVSAPRWRSNWAHLAVRDAVLSTHSADRGRRRVRFWIWPTSPRGSDVVTVMSAASPPGTGSVSMLDRHAPRGNGCCCRQRRLDPSRRTIAKTPGSKRCV
jgi:hypothetical protein